VLKIQVVNSIVINLMRRLPSLCNEESGDEVYNMSAGTGGPQILHKSKSSTGIPMISSPKIVKKPRAIIDCDNLMQESMSNVVKSFDFEEEYD
jgi:hypothetical protein